MLLDSSAQQTVPPAGNQVFAAATRHRCPGSTHNTAGDHQQSSFWCADGRNQVLHQDFHNAQKKEMEAVIKTWNKVFITVTSDYSSVNPCKRCIQYSICIQDHPSPRYEHHTYAKLLLSWLNRAPRYIFSHMFTIHFMIFHAHTHTHVQILHWLKQPHFFWHRPPFLRCVASALL